MRLFEFTNTKPLIIIDVQAAYYSYFGNEYLQNVFNFIRKHTGPVIIIYNTETAGETKEDVVNFYAEKELDYEDVNRLIFIPKDFGFLRNWMDMGVPKNIIIKTLRYMYQNQINDSREIPEEILQELMGEYFDEKYIDDMIYLPDLSIGQLKKYNNCYICGGGRQECFKEMLILFNTFNIRYTIVDKLVY